MILHSSFLLPVMPGETPVGYASRLALQFGCSLRVFCSRIDVPLQKLLDGDPVAVAALRAVCALPEGAFADTTFVRAPGRRFLLAGETLSIQQVNREALRICPACVEEQLARVRKVHEVWAPREWHLNPLQVCNVHSMTMLTVDIPRHQRQDFAGLLTEALRRGSLTQSKVETVRESGLGLHIRRRISGIADEHWLSCMPLHAAIRTAEMVGTAATRGVHAPWMDQTLSQRFEAGRIGYHLLNDGEDGLRGLFTQLQSKAESKRSSTDGLIASFDRLHVTLTVSKDPAFDPLRDVLRRHIIETMPFGPGEKVLGQEVTQRHLHSARTVAPELGVSLPTVERRLRFIGLLEHTGKGATLSQSTFDARTHADAIRRLGGALQRAEAGRYLGLKVVYEDVAPILDMVGSMNVDKTRPIEQLFAKEDLDAFLESLMSKAAPEPAEADFDHLVRASKRTRIGMAAILEMIRRGDISDVRISPAHKGIMALMVRKADVLAALVANRPWMTLTSAAKTFKMRDTTLSALVRNKIIPSEGTSPIMLLPDDVERFTRTYVTRRAVTLQYGHLSGPANRYSVTQAIRDAGVKPAFDESKSLLTFFRRDEVIAALGPPPS